MVVSIAPTMYLRTNFLERQRRDKECLEKLYDAMPIGIEQKFMSAEKFGVAWHIPLHILSRVFKLYEDCGILARRLEFSAKGPDGETIFGRSFHWTLLCSREEARKKLENFLRQEREEANHPPASRGTSLKSRIMTALSEHQKFETMDDLAKIIRKGNENVDYHNVTHLLEALHKQGKVDFDRGHTKDAIPYNIRLTKNGAKSVHVPFSEEDGPVDIISTIGKPVSVPEDEFDTIPQIVPVTTSYQDKYPLIMKLSTRKANLEQAAKLAETSGEDEIALQLMESASKPFSEFETEVMNLFLELIACQSK